MESGIGILLTVGFAIVGIVLSARKTAQEAKKRAAAFDQEGKPLNMEETVSFSSKEEKVSSGVPLEPKRTPTDKPAPVVTDRIKARTEEAPKLEPLRFDRNEIVKGVLYAEILGKPKALRR